MRFLSVQSLLATVVAAGVIVLTHSMLPSEPCDEPLEYRIGILDQRFGIGTSTAQTLLLEAERVWEEQADRELFVYDPEADFEVNFIYDERQETTNAVEDFESALSDLELSHSEITALYSERKQRYEAALADYQEEQEEYEVDLRDFNRRVSEWNERGGAPPAVYTELQSERDALDARLAALNQRQQQVEELRLAVNELVSEGNHLAREYNQTASTFMERFGETRSFDQATYESSSINVYQFEGMDDLRLALAHEFGHAIGIKHVSNPESIMYYLMEDQSLDSLELSEEDITAFNATCKYE